jgi:hypothetical protein
VRFSTGCSALGPTRPKLKSVDQLRISSAGRVLSRPLSAYKAPPDEPPVDHRTDAERDHDRARALLDVVGEQGALFPLSHFEPVTTTLKELSDYAREQREMTGRFAERDRKRDAYLEQLIAAAGNDLSMVWQEAHNRLPDPDTAPVMV